MEKILLLEHDENFRQSFRDCLNLIGYDVINPDFGEQITPTKENIEKWNPDLILLNKELFSNENFLINKEFKTVIFHSEINETERIPDESNLYFLQLPKSLRNLNKYLKNLMHN